MATVLSDAEIATERLEAEVCTLAGQIAAATCRFVLLIAELDRRGAWAEWGCRSMAHWLSWKCAMGLQAARQHVRVGRALEALPAIGAAFAAGELSFSKVRALVRVATPANERQLLDFAREATAAQVEIGVRGYEYAYADLETTRAQLESRAWRTIHEDDGSVTVTVRMPRDAYELLARAVDLARQEVPESDTAVSRVDALNVLAQHFLAGRSERVPTEVVVHVDDADLARGDVSPVVERLLCDTSVRIMSGDKRVRRKRTIPIALRRAIERRDKRTCRFPSCSNTRALHVHHVIWVSRRGETTSKNCILLCPFHHRAVHEGGWRLFGDADQSGGLIFHDPRNRRLHESAPSRVATRPITTLPDIARISSKTIATASGQRMQRAAVVDALCATPPFRHSDESGADPLPGMRTSFNPREARCDHLWPTSSP